MRQASADSDLPDDVAAALERYDCDDDPIEEGAVIGVIGFGTILLVVDYLPAALLTVVLQGSWRLMVLPTIDLVIWTFLAAMVGSGTMWILSKTIASSRVSRHAARQGFLIGCFSGAIVGAGCSAVMDRSSGSTLVDMILTGGLTGSCTTLGLLFAMLGSLAGAIAIRGETHGRGRRIRNATVGIDGPGARFQFGIMRILLLMTATAVLIAIPVHLVKRLLQIPQLQSFGMEFTLLVVPLTLLELMIVTWFVMRGPSAFTRLRAEFARWREMKSSRDELERYLASRISSFRDLQNEAMKTTSIRK